MTCVALLSVQGRDGFVSDFRFLLMGASHPFQSVGKLCWHCNVTLHKTLTIAINKLTKNKVNKTMADAEGK